MLMEISKVEQRYVAVVAIIRDGFTVSEVVKSRLVRATDTIEAARAETDGLPEDLLAITNAQLRQ